jgi:DNA helicase II / ATP-dependent DNA helicase PcrA
MPKTCMQGWIVAALSDEQKLAFSGTSSRSSILAAAGSGKTRTLIHLLAHDLCSGIPASGIVAFTFTEKAAEELLARIHFLGKEKLPKVDLSGIFIGTIHSWCLQYLYSQSDFYNITPIDELHLDALVGRLYDVLELGTLYNEAFPRAIEPFLTDIEVFYNEHLPFRQVPPRIRPALMSFIEVLSMNRLLTFGGMIRSATEHLQTKGPLAELQSLYVDEYQDVNPAQTALIRAMLPVGSKLRVVGDDLQSIYNWRGSDVTRILEFPQEFAPAEVIRLSMNYRSRPEIVTVANSVAEDIVLKDPVKVTLVQINLR